MNRLNRFDSDQNEILEESGYMESFSVLISFSAYSSEEFYPYISPT